MQSERHSNIQEISSDIASYESLLFQEYIESEDCPVNHGQFANKGQEVINAIKHNYSTFKEVMYDG